jgi:hypothetical protein
MPISWTFAVLSDLLVVLALFFSFFFISWDSKEWIHLIVMSIAGCSIWRILWRATSGWGPTGGDEGGAGDCRKLCISIVSFDCPLLIHNLNCS